MQGFFATQHLWLPIPCRPRNYAQQASTRGGCHWVLQCPVRHLYKSALLKTRSSERPVTPGSWWTLFSLFLSTLPPCFAPYLLHTCMFQYCSVRMLHAAPSSQPHVSLSGMFGRLNPAALMQPHLGFCLFVYIHHRAKPFQKAQQGPYMGETQPDGDLLCSAVPSLQFLP